MLHVLSLCSGIGGLERGVNMALGGRARTVCYVEREVYAACALLARMEDSSLDRAPVWDDLTTFDAGRWRGAVDLVTAGFPCQPWSVAGKRKGTEDERWIWPAIVRIIRDCEAPLVFLENVPGLLRHGLREVLSDLAEIGFDAEWTSVRASDVGAPHRRERIFILGWLEHAECPGLEGRGHPWPARFPFPPGPGDAVGWERRLAAGGPAPAISALRARADGFPVELAVRTDALRALGNACVPAQACAAFRELAGRVIA